MNKPQIIFLSGPISDKPDTYKADFDAAAQAVVSAGDIPLNPATLPFGLAQRDYMRITLAMMDAADLVLQLPGWSHSKGALAEAALADKIGLPMQDYADFLADMRRPAPEPEQEPERPAPASRVERMFGKRETWGQNPPEAQAPAQEGDPDTADFERRAARGFLIVECEDCHTTREFCSRSPITYNRCKKCGHDTPLDATTMRPAYAKCKCGREYKYKTNADAETLSINCIACGAPIDMKLNARGTAYVTLQDAGGALRMKPFYLDR